MKWIILLFIGIAGCNSHEFEPTVVVYGDSVSKGYAVESRHDLCGQADLRHNPYLTNESQICGENYSNYSVGIAVKTEHNDGCAITELRNMREDTGYYTVLMFNTGLHDFQNVISPYGCGMSTSDQYRKNIESLADEAMKHADYIVWVDTTQVPTGQGMDPVDIQDVANPIAEDIAREHGFYILHLQSAYQLPNDIHYTREGYKNLGQQVAECVLLVLAGDESDSCHR